MVNAAAIDTGSSSLSLFSRAATADAVLSAGATTNAAQQDTARVTNLGQTLRYNSFEFSYRQDFGKIVLLRQEPETGEVVQQFPTEYYLKRYAESQRTAPQAANESGTPDVAPAQTQGEPAAGSSAPVVAAPVVASAPTISSAPALPNGGVGLGAGVDITI